MTKREISWFNSIVSTYLNLKFTFHTLCTFLGALDLFSWSRLNNKLDNLGRINQRMITVSLREHDWMRFAVLRTMKYSKVITEREDRSHNSSHLAVISRAPSTCWLNSSFFFFLRSHRMCFLFIYNCVINQHNVFQSSQMFSRSLMRVAMKKFLNDFLEWRKRHARLNRTTQCWSNPTNILDYVNHIFRKLNHEITVKIKIFVKFNEFSISNYSTVERFTLRTVQPRLLLEKFSLSSFVEQTSKWQDVKTLCGENWK